MARRNGLLLINLGTPDSTDVEDVRQFLSEFLGDPLVLGGFSLSRKALVNLLICPLRGPRSAAAYEKVWTEAGSPIAVHGRELRDKVAAALPNTVVTLAMRYRVPSIAAALAELRAQGADSLVVLPLFPQFSSSTTESIIQDLSARHQRMGRPFALKFIRDFYEHPAFIEAAAAVARPILDRFQPDLLLMSYHGVPEDYLRKDDPSGSRCLWSAECCDSIDEVNRSCYRAQCFATSRALAKALALDEESWCATFQSQFGPKTWTGPATAKVIEDLPSRGIKKLAVICPAFAADCLETLEEVGMGLKIAFIENGGESFELIPCVNAHEAWVDGVVQLFQESLGAG
ncbi:MAG: ferrochelatase [Planctomycetota bacterium]